MADLSGPPEQPHSRGQIVLLAAFILAVVFVVLALVVNSAIFTENLATRDNVPGSQDALEYRYEVAESVGGLVAAINDDNERTDGDITDGVDDLDIRSGIDQSSLGRIATVQYESHETGYKIAQDEPGELTSADDLSDWDVGTDVEARNLLITITEPPSDDTFELVVENSSDEWRMVVEEDNGDLAVTVNNPDGNEATCTRNLTTPTTIDVTSGSIGGKPCPALTRTSDGEQMYFAVGFDEYDVRFENGNTIEGTYSMVFDSEPEIANLDTEDEADPYYTTDAIYSVTVAYEFYTSQVGYETDIRVAPGEAPR